MTPHISPPPYCIGCRWPTYDNRHGKGWQWYCRQWSPTGIPCTNIAVLRERCLHVEAYAKEAGL